jgi:hypothetical protein
VGGGQSGRGVGIQAAKAYHKQCKAETRAERREAAAATVAQHPDDGSLHIGPELPFPVNLDRFMRRYVMFMEGGTGTRFADLTRIGQRNWILELNKLQVQYANVTFWDVEREQVVTLIDAYLKDTSEMRRTAMSLEFDPCQPFGFRYTSDRVGVINTYCAPAHPMAGGDTRVFHWFLEHLVRDPAERAYVYAWLACKVQRPDTVGHSVIMVAADAGQQVQGTGRGTFVTIIEQLFGPAYLTRKNMDDISGRRGNHWNDWIVGKLWCSIPEVLESGEGNTYRDRKRLYETLKDIFDPNDKRKGIQKRGTTAFDDNCYMTGIMATNHADALVIPRGDRRFAIISNGARMTPDMVKTILAWRADPANIGALYRELFQYDWRAQYDPSGNPIMTTAKQRMIELSEGGSDAAVHEFRSFAQAQGIEIVSDALIARWALAIHGMDNSRQIKAAFRILLHRLPDAVNQLRFDGARVRVQALRNAEQWQQRDREQIAAAYKYAEQIIDRVIGRAGVGLAVVPMHAFVHNG